uniref:Uncharacterized protein n=1 Tax=Romanomermis culicivorax TaxID=13658 RepID=A0A915HVG1_ROMCU
GEGGKTHKPIKHKPCENWRVLSSSVAKQQALKSLKMAKFGRTLTKRKKFTFNAFFEIAFWIVWEYAPAADHFFSRYLLRVILAQRGHTFVVNAQTGDLPVFEILVVIKDHGGGKDSDSGKDFGGNENRGGGKDRRSGRDLGGGTDPGGDLVVSFSSSMSGSTVSHANVLQSGTYARRVFCTVRQSCKNILHARVSERQVHLKRKLFDAYQAKEKFQLTLMSTPNIKPMTSKVAAPIIIDINRPQQHPIKTAFRPLASRMRDIFCLPVRTLKFRSLL